MTDRNEFIKEPLDKIAGHLEEEARMVLPGIQALFGFQLIAVFNQRFADLSDVSQGLHFAALLCTAVAVLLVLAPAAYHRQAEPDGISSHFCRFGSAVLTWSLVPLAFAICADLYVIQELIFKSIPLGIAIALAMFLLLSAGWFVYPQYRRLRRMG
jgi:hypothetical protein